MPPSRRRSRARAHPFRALLLACLAAGTLGGCVCRPAHVGPYGGLHPGGCWVW